jgi:hypothetical protein
MFSPSNFHLMFRILCDLIAETDLALLGELLDRQTGEAVGHFLLRYLMAVR